MCADSDVEHGHSAAEEVNVSLNTVVAQSFSDSTETERQYTTNSLLLIRAFFLLHRTQVEGMAVSLLISMAIFGFSEMSGG